MDVTFVTSNPGKFAEAQRIFAEFGIGLRWDRRALVEPQAEGVGEVVHAKLATAAADRSEAVVVEDSGLFVDALGGFPGVYSRYVLDTIGLEGILRLCQGKPRSARFLAAAGFRAGRREFVTHGEVIGSIAASKRGEFGFGYDPIFIPRGKRRTFAEMLGPEKDRISHRGVAIRALAQRVARIRTE